jgi:alpha-N-arabinofuranosidase
MIARRDFLKQAAIGAAAQSALHAADANTIVLDSQPLFDISPHLYMQFMEPLGATDSSVDASWDWDADDWRKDFVDLTRDLAPDVVRFGGLFSRYYHWREGVGQVSKRPAMRNYVWGGKETNRVGTHEFVDFCRRAGAAPLYCVNFLSDGEARYRATPEGNRSGDAREAADWVSYANDPDNRERKANGAADPLNIKLWQIGNETSYGTATFSKEDSIAHTIEFAKAMKERDRSVQLIGWGDRGRGPGATLWAGDLLKQAGEYLDLVAIHMMGQSPKRPDTVLKGLRYEKEPERAWAELLELSNVVEKRVSELEETIAGVGSSAGIAITEGHLSLSPPNSNPILREWLSAVYHARSLNIYQRHGARVKIATAADFQGNRWTNTAVMLPTPRGASYLMPAGSIARLFKKHNGTQAVAVKSAPSGLDIAGSRRGGKFYLHVANLEYSKSIAASFAIAGARVTAGRVFAIDPEDLRTYVDQDQPDVFKLKEAALPGPAPQWRFAPGAVCAIELDTV